MTTPTGLLTWGQAGNYNAVNDRLVIRGLAGPSFFGLVQAPTLAAGSGLAVNIGPWIAIVDCGDGTSAVIGSTANASINETAGGASQRTDVLWADINVDATSQWSLSWLPSPVSGRTGVALGTAVVPASAATAAAMTFTPGAASQPGPSAPIPYTPQLVGGGSATYTGVGGYYYVLGDLVFFTAYLTLNATGSGATAMSFNGPPVNIDRTTRQVCYGHLEGISALNGSWEAVAFTGGSGNNWDRIRTSTGANITGAQLTPTGCIFLLQGWYRKA